MFWNILLLILSVSLLILGILKAWWDEKQKKPGRSATRDIILALLLAILVGIKPIIEFAKPPGKMEQQVDEMYRDMKELKEKEGLAYYKDGIPQSDNFNLRKLFEQGKEHLDKYEYAKAISAFRRAWALRDLEASERVALLTYIGIAQYEQTKWDQALGNWKDAYDAAVDAGDEQGQAAALGNLGIVYHDKGEWSKAIEFYEKSLEIKEKTGDDQGMAQT